MAPSVSSRKDDDSPSTSENFDLEKTAEEAKSLIEKIVKDVGKKSATRQLIFGSASGWFVIVICFTFVQPCYRNSYAVLICCLPSGLPVSL